MTGNRRTLIIALASVSGLVLLLLTLLAVLFFMSLDAQEAKVVSSGGTFNPNWGFAAASCASILIGLVGQVALVWELLRPRSWRRAKLIALLGLGSSSVFWAVLVFHDLDRATSETVINVLTLPFPLALGVLAAWLLPKSPSASSPPR